MGRRILSRPLLAASLGLVGAGSSVAIPLTMSYERFPKNTDDSLNNSLDQTSSSEESQGGTSQVSANPGEQASFTQVSQEQHPVAPESPPAPVAQSTQNTPNYKNFQGWEALWLEINKGFKGKQQQGVEMNLPLSEDVKRVFLKDGEVSGQWDLISEEWRDCKVGAKGQEAYCGFLHLRHRNNSYKVKVGFNGNQGNKGRWEVIVVKQSNNDKPSWYSALTGGWQLCSSSEWQAKVQADKRRNCENWRWTDHFNGKNGENKNFWGNVTVLSVAKTMNK